MAEYRGVDGIARKLVKEYRGVDGIARKLVKEYRGVDGVARQYFSSGPYYKIGALIYSAGNSGGLEEYVQEVKDGVMTISGTSTGTAKVKIPIYVYGDLGGKKISFTYKTKGYNAMYATIEITESGADGEIEKSQLTSITAKSFEAILDENTTRVMFSVWFSLSPTTASLEVWDLTIDGETVLN